MQYVSQLLIAAGMAQCIRDETAGVYKRLARSPPPTYYCYTTHCHCE